MRYLHTMLRVHDLDTALTFFCDHLGLTEVRRRDSERGRYTLVFLGTGADGDDATIELTHNWDDIYDTCARLQADGVVINRPPRDGRMAFVKSPDGHSVELLQAGEALPPEEPWASMGNTGSW